MKKKYLYGLLFFMAIFFLMIFIMSVYFDYNYGSSNQENYFISGLSIIYLVISIITLSGFFYIKYKILGNINKRYLFITIGLFIVVILFPIKFVFKDGGTKVYQSMIYKVIYWNRLNDNYLDGFKAGREIHLFPFNFYPLDYYDDIMPSTLYVRTEDDQMVIAKIGTYCWSKKIGKMTNHICSDTVSPILMDYNDEIIVKNGEKIYLDGNYQYVNSLRIYKFGLSDGDEWYMNSEEYLVDYPLGYNSDGKYIKVDVLSGSYVIVVNTDSLDGDVSYSFKIEVEN